MKSLSTELWWWNFENNWNCKRCIQFDVENYNCMTHKYENKKNNYKRICLYGCETWTMTTRNMTKLQSFEMWAYRKMMKISWRENKTNEEVLEMADEQLYITPTIKKRKIPTLVTWSDVTSTGGYWRDTGGQNKQRKAKNGVDDKYHRMDGNATTGQPTFFKNTAPGDDDDYY